MSDNSQAALRTIILFGMTAAFVALWSADARSTTAMTLAERTRRIVPAHARGEARSLARATQQPNPTTAGDRRPTIVAPLEELPGGAYRVVFGDGRVEWLTVVRGQGATPAVAVGGVIVTTLNAERVHAIRVSERPLRTTVVR
ncbi:MAG: hypothetical protein KF774_09450 [Planctomyces sp.]|nr:hypothetical protein [Planctomyces sp.]